MNQVRILGVGAGAPSLRLLTADVNAAWDRKGGRGQAGLCGSDEDSLTLAWDAATAAIDAAGLDAGVIDGLWWGTSRPPFLDGPSHAILSSALGLAPHVAGILCSGSPHSGIEALLASADAIKAGSARFALVVASDDLRPAPGSSYETRAGAGAAAFVLADEGGGARIVSRVTRSRPLLDRYRGDGDTSQRDIYDGRLFRERIFLPLVAEVTDALAGEDISSWSVPDPDGRLGSVVAKRAKAPNLTCAPIYSELGDTGAAAAMLGIIGGLADIGTSAAVAYGGGRATAVLFETELPVAGTEHLASALREGKPVSYSKALRVRSQLIAGGETVPMGVPPESALFVRGAEEMLQLLGGRCVDCGTINTPPSIHPHCANCGGPKLEAVQLARQGTVHTFVINYTMPAPFEAPLPIAVLDLDDGSRIMLQVANDGSQVEIGRRMRLVLRKYAHERGVPVYGFKAQPITESQS